MAGSARKSKKLYSFLVAMQVKIHSIKKITKKNNYKMKWLDLLDFISIMLF